MLIWIFRAALLGGAAFFSYSATVEERGAREVVVGIADPASDPRFSALIGKNLWEAYQVDPSLATEYNSAQIGYSNAVARADALKRERTDRENTKYIFGIICVLLFALSFIPWIRLIESMLQRGAEKATRAIAPIATVTRESLGGSGALIIGSEKMKRFSTADELLKWQQLHESGAITDCEYSEARDKLLGRGKA